MEIVLLCGREGMTNRGVGNVFNNLHPEHIVSHQAVGMLLNKFKLTGSVKDKEKKRRMLLLVMKSIVPRFLQNFQSAQLNH